jgi:thioredoxin reductase (NADPH)
LLQEKIRTDPKFEVHTNHRVSEFKRSKEGKLASVLVEDRASQEVTEFYPGAAFVFIGLDPNTAFLRETMGLDQWGFVLTNDIFQTSIPGVFAAGDVRAGSTKQLASATGEGVTALLMVRNLLQKLGDIAAHEEAYSGAPGPPRT